MGWDSCHVCVEMGSTQHALDQRSLRLELHDCRLVKTGSSSNVKPVTTRRNPLLLNILGNLSGSSCLLDLEVLHRVPYITHVQIRLKEKQTDW